MKKGFKKLTFILIPLFIIIIMWGVLNKIKTYDETYFLGILDKRNIEDYKTSAYLYESGNYQKYSEYMSEKIEPIDLSQKGIVCEYIRYQDDRDENLYAVLYNDRTIKYIIADIEFFPHFGHIKYYKLIADKKEEFEDDDPATVCYPNIFYIYKDYEVSTVKLSLGEYFYLVNRLKIINLSNLGKKVSDTFTEYWATGIYFNDLCYTGRRGHEEKSHIKIAEREVINKTERYIEKLINQNISSDKKILE